MKYVEVFLGAEKVLSVTGSKVSALGVFRTKIHANIPSIIEPGSKKFGLFWEECS